MNNAQTTAVSTNTKVTPLAQIVEGYNIMTTIAKIFMILLSTMLSFMSSATTTNGYPIYNSAISNEQSLVDVIKPLVAEKRWRTLLLYHMWTSPLSRYEYMKLTPSQRPTCPYCNNFNGVRKMLLEPGQEYNMAYIVVPSRDAYITMMSFGNIGSDYPVLSLHNMPTSEDDVSAEWFKTNVLYNKSGSSFSTTEEATKRCEEIIEIIKTNNVVKVKSPTVTPTVTEIETKSLEPQYISVDVPLYVVEGHVLNITFRRSGYIDQRLVLHVFVDDQYIGDVSWKAKDGSAKQILYIIPIDDRYSEHRVVEVSVRTIDRTVVTR